MSKFIGRKLTEKHRSWWVCLRIITRETTIENCPHDGQHCFKWVTRRFLLSSCHLICGLLCFCAAVGKLSTSFGWLVLSDKAAVFFMMISLFRYGCRLFYDNDCDDEVYGEYVKSSGWIESKCLVWEESEIFEEEENIPAAGERGVAYSQVDIDGKLYICKYQARPTSHGNDEV